MNVNIDLANIIQLCLSLSSLPSYFIGLAIRPKIIAFGGRFHFDRELASGVVESHLGSRRFAL